jgi:cell division protein FtsI (penicillin-binding protein 3)
MSASTAREVGRLLEAVVSEGTAHLAQIDGYRLAGKTGTAQKAVAGGYSPTDHIAVFAGYAPSRGARLVGAVMIDRPRGDIHGGSVAAPVFAAIARQAMIALGVPADGDDDASRRELLAWSATTETAPDAPALAAPVRRESGP